MIRNPLIATVLYYNKTIDAFGTGFERVFRLCKDIDYSYSSNQFGFTFEFIRSNNDMINDTINDTISEGLTTDERLVLELLKKNGRKFKTRYSEYHWKVCIDNQQSYQKFKRTEFD